MMRIVGTLTAVFFGVLASDSFAAPKNREPAEIEKGLLKLSLKLKPIPEEMWQTIAGTKSSEKYQIVQDDTLYDISKRLFGDPNYWPKIWSLNNPTITNPHLIYPGNTIVFLSGSGTSLPSVAIEKTNSSNSAAPEKNQTKIAHEDDERSEDWKNLPKQSWEKMSVTIPDETEQLGIGKDTKEKLRLAVSEVKLSLRSVAATKKIEPVGEVESAITASKHLALGNTVFIRAQKEGLQIGQTYALTYLEPRTLISPRKDMQGYSYPIMGTVVIQQELNEVYVGKILTADHLITREMVLIPAPPRIPLLDPAQGPDPMEAGIIMDPEFAAPMGVQYQQVFVDRGSNDGMTPGMTFGLYEDEDPHTHLPIGKKNMHKSAEIMILQVSENFSSAVIERSDSPIFSKMIATLISDPGALQKEIRSITPPSLPKSSSELSTPATTKNSSGDTESESQPQIRAQPKIDANAILSDELDQLDTTDDTILDNEKRELRQLEHWQKNSAHSTSGS